MLKLPTIWWAQLWDSDFQYRLAQSQAQFLQGLNRKREAHTHTQCSTCFLSEKASRGLKRVRVQSSFGHPISSPCSFLSALYLFPMQLCHWTPCTKTWWIWGDWWEEKPQGQLEFKRVKREEPVHVQKGITEYYHPPKTRSLTARQKWKVIMTILH